jgi:hypothetical protein
MHYQGKYGQKMKLEDFSMRKADPAFDFEEIGLIFESVKFLAGQRDKIKNKVFSFYNYCSQQIESCMSEFSKKEYQDS